MSKFKKLTLTCIAVLSAFIFVACSNGVDATSDDKPTGNPEISLQYDANIYTCKMEDVLKAGQSFVNQSVKSKEAVEELFDGPADNPEIKLSYNKMFISTKLRMLSRTARTL